METVKDYIHLSYTNAVVTPLRKAASYIHVQMYEQCKTNLGNQIFHAILSRSAT